MKLHPHTQRALAQRAYVLDSEAMALWAITPHSDDSVALDRLEARINRIIQHMND